MRQPATSAGWGQPAPANLLRDFLFLVLLLSVPLWLAASLLDATRIVPVRLPLSALQFLAVLLAAVLATRRGGGSVRALLRRGFDLGRMGSPWWRPGVFVLMPLVVLLSFGLTVLFGPEVPARMTPLLSLPVLLLVYAISAYCEQIGWTAVMTDALLTRLTVLQAGLVTGVVWALWHVIPFIQTHHAAPWIVWQCVYSVVFRVLLTGVYVRANRSVFVTIALHATYNTALSFLPYYGSSYDPRFMTLATLAVTVPVIVSGRGDRHAREVER